MQRSSTSQAVASSAVPLVVFALCVGAFLPPFLERTVSSIPLTIAFGMAIAVSFVLHIAFVGIAANRAHRSAALWAVLTVVLFPVASIVGLILFEWFSHQGNRGTAERVA